MCLEADDAAFIIQFRSVEKLVTTFFFPLPYVKALGLKGR
jgi:hypothetical protein